MRKLITCTLLLLWSVGKTHAGEIQSPVLNQTSIRQYEKLELSFAINQTYTNPYDPDVVKVDAEITLPDNTTKLIPCFYYVPSRFNSNEATENPSGAQWKLRYTPTLIGNYQVKIRVSDGTITVSDPIQFSATAGNAKGFVRIDPTNKQFMRFDNQTPYYPVGYNLCWNNGTLVQFYNTWITQRMAPNKVNWMRYWLTDFARQALEWKPNHWSGWYNGLGNYSQRAAGILDSTLTLCETNGVYMQLVLQHHGQFSTNVNPQWGDNPYNTANGGPIANPGEFFTNTQVRKQTQKQYRYIVARWGYSPNVLSWELFNEVEYTNGADAAIDSWHDEMSQYLKSIDVNQHMVNTSSGQDNSTLPLLDNNTAMDQLQWHTYAGSVENVIYSQIQSYRSYTKSVMNGEFGTGTEYPLNGSHPDNWGDHVRKTMWISMMSGAPSMFWYWDTYVEAKNLYALFKPLGQYMENVNIVTETDAIPRRITFASNPASIGTASVSAGLAEWSGTNKPDPFTSTIDEAGVASNTASLTNYIHGSWQNRNRDLRFTVTFQNTGSVSLNVNGVSASGSKTIQVFVDNALKTTWNVTTNGTYTYSAVPSGKHEIRLYNSGEDWVQFGQILFSNVSIRPLQAYGYTGSKKAYGYITNTTYGEWADPSAIKAVNNAALKLGKMEKGTYDVTFTDPITGGTTSQQFTTITDSLTIQLPSIGKDLAYKVSYVSEPTATEPNTRHTSLFYPNPCQNELIIQTKQALAIQSVRLFNLLSQPFAAAYTVKGDKCYVDVSSLPTGLYAVCYTTRLGLKASAVIIKQ
jgi:hypothetical protein